MSPTGSEKNGEQVDDTETKTNDIAGSPFLRRLPRAIRDESSRYLLVRPSCVLKPVEPCDESSAIGRVLKILKLGVPVEPWRAFSLCKEICAEAGTLFYREQTFFLNTEKERRLFMRVYEFPRW